MPIEPISTNSISNISKIALSPIKQYFCYVNKVRKQVSHWENSEISLKYELYLLRDWLKNIMPMNKPENVNIRGYRSLEPYNINSVETLISEGLIPDRHKEHIRIHFKIADQIKHEIDSIIEDDGLDQKEKQTQIADVVNSRLSFIPSYTMKIKEIADSPFTDIEICLAKNKTMIPCLKLLFRSANR